MYKSNGKKEVSCLEPGEIIRPSGPYDNNFVIKSIDITTPHGVILVSDDGRTRVRHRECIMQTYIKSE